MTTRSRQKLAAMRTLLSQLGRRDYAVAIYWCDLYFLMETGYTMSGLDLSYEERLPEFACTWHLSRADRAIISRVAMEGKGLPEKIYASSAEALRDLGESEETIIHLCREADYYEAVDTSLHSASRNNTYTSDNSATVSDNAKIILDVLLLNFIPDPVMLSRIVNIYQRNKKITGYKFEYSGYCREFYSDLFSLIADGYIEQDNFPCDLGVAEERELTRWIDEVRELGGKAQLILAQRLQLTDKGRAQTMWPYKISNVDEANKILNSGGV